MCTGEGVPKVRTECVQEKVFLHREKNISKYGITNHVRYGFVISTTVDRKNNERCSYF